MKLLGLSQILIQSIAHEIRCDCQSRQHACPVSAEHMRDGVESVITIPNLMHQCPETVAKKKRSFLAMQKQSYQQHCFKLGAK
jgi:hypothetical protein